MTQLPESDPLAFAAWQFIVRSLPPEDLPRIATETLVRGFDSEALRQLAGAGPGDVRDNRDLFAQALDELGVTLPSEEEAWWSLIRRQAERIVEGEISPVDGGMWMWSAWNTIEEEGDLRIFVGLMSEHQEHPAGRAQIELDVVEEAKVLLGRKRPRRWLRLQARYQKPSLVHSNHREPVNLPDLPVGDGLRQAVFGWEADFDQRFNDDSGRAKFHSAADAVAFVERGRDLANQLQDELGDDWHIEYYQEPGVRMGQS